MRFHLVIRVNFLEMGSDTQLTQMKAMEYRQQLPDTPSKTKSVIRNKKLKMKKLQNYTA